ncbi:MAG TPA: heme exporter protein CcmB, partial [Spirochaetota bacterium]|nr:heme exporter protein CcmB [Spirochaetota bacterium]
MIKALWRNIQKDILIEFRSRIIVSIVLSFSVIVTISIGFATGGIINSPLLHAVILWIIIFFSGMNTLSHVFFREIEESTALFGVIHYPAAVIYLSKLLINCCVMVVIAIMVIIIYTFVISVSVYYGVYLIAILIAGSLSLAFATTVIGAIAALAGARGGLFTILA